MPDSVDVLLVGGGVASVRCARTLRRSGFAGSIAIVGDEPHLPYNRPPLSKELLRDDVPDELVLAEPPAWYERRDVAPRLRAAVGALDLDRGVADLTDGTSLRFDRALLATGAQPIIPPIPGIELALPLRTLDDARRLRAAALAAGPGARVAVIGGGFIGVEVASALATLGLRPVVIERAPALWAGTLGTSIAAWAQERLASEGVEVRLGVTVTGVDASGVSAERDRFEAAVVVVATGVTPRDAVAAAAGLAVDGGILVDSSGRTSHPAVWAAGDVATVDGSRVEHWHAAREAGERAARSMLGLDVGAVPVPWVFSEVAGVAVDVIGSPDPLADERRLGGTGVVAWLRDGRAVGIAIMGGGMSATEARRLVADGVDLDAIERSAAASAA